MSETIVAPAAGRIDKILAESLGVSRNQVEKLIRDGLVEIAGGTVTKTSHKLAAGEVIGYRFLEAQKREVAPVDFDVEILYEDEWLMVVNKPAGLVVHPAPSVNEPTLVDWLVQRGISLSTISGEERHGIVHRIDRETTGALVIAKSNGAHQQLSDQLRDKSMGRYYLAIVDYPLKENTIIEQPIGRNPRNRLKMAIVPEGRASKTAFVKIAESRERTELIAAKLYTGRTHQIRVHLGTLGRHIVGDRLYGPEKSGRSGVERVFLHAALLYLIHPQSGERMTFAAPLFEDMRTYLQKHFDAAQTAVADDPKRLEACFRTTGDFAVISPKRSM
jgi:23S rRNA pseudouridine1911/1915/1917 synthase